VEVNGPIILKGAVRYQLREMEGAPPTGRPVSSLSAFPVDAQTKLATVMKMQK
jgi:hypothetical protein